MAPRKATHRQVREDFLRNRKADKVVIKRGGDVHVLGIPPNTNYHCWYFAGMIWDLQVELGHALQRQREDA